MPHIHTGDTQHATCQQQRDVPGSLVAVAAATSKAPSLPIRAVPLRALLYHPGNSTGELPSSLTLCRYGPVFQANQQITHLLLGELPDAIRPESDGTRRRYGLYYNDIVNHLPKSRDGTFNP